MHSWKKFALFYSKHFRFRSKQNIIEAIVELTEKIFLGNSFKKGLLFFFDLRKAFDTLDHETLRNLMQVTLEALALNCLTPTSNIVSSNLK